MSLGDWFSYLRARSQLKAYFDKQILRFVELLNEKNYRARYGFDSHRLARTKAHQRTWW